MKREIEFYLCRLYLRPGGFWLSIGELVFFDSGDTWAALALGYNKDDGWQLELLTLEPDRPAAEPKREKCVTFSKN